MPNAMRRLVSIRIVACRSFLLDFAELAHLLVDALVAQRAVLGEKAVHAHIVARYVGGELGERVAFDAQAVVADERADRLHAEKQRVAAAFRQTAELAIDLLLGDGERLLERQTAQLVGEQRGASDGGEAAVAAKADLGERFGFGIDAREQLHLDGAALLLADAAEGVRPIGDPAGGGIGDDVERGIGVFGDGRVVLDLVHIGRAEERGVLGEVLFCHGLPFALDETVGLRWSGASRGFAGWLLRIAHLFDAVPFCQGFALGVAEVERRVEEHLVFARHAGADIVERLLILDLAVDGARLVG